MELGETLRRYREREGMPLRELASRCGLSPTYLSRLESGQREPTWATLRAIGRVWNRRPVLTFATDGLTGAELAAWARLDPETRLWRSNAGAPPALTALVRALGEDVAVTGAAAAVLQGQQADVDVLEVVVVDADDVLARLVVVLQTWWAFYQPMEVDEYRALRRTAWVMRDVDVDVQLVTELPPTTPIALDGIVVRAVALPHLLETDALPQ